MRYPVEIRVNWSQDRAERCLRQTACRAWRLGVSDGERGRARAYRGRDLTWYNAGYEAAVLEAGQGASLEDLEREHEEADNYEAEEQRKAEAEARERLEQAERGEARKRFYRLCESQSLRDGGLSVLASAAGVPVEQARGYWSAACRREMVQAGSLGREYECAQGWSDLDSDLQTEAREWAYRG